MIRQQDTGTRPDTSTAEQPPGRRHGTFVYEVTKTGRDAHRAPEQPECEVAS